jgi:hypothetical protein
VLRSLIARRRYGISRHLGRSVLGSIEGRDHAGYDMAFL